jgi:hypothetical protein
LDLSAVDGASDVGEMAVSNDGQSWEVSPYTSWKNWRIAGNPGVNTVYAKFKDVAGNWSDVVSDTIIYDGAPPQASAPDQAFVEGSSIVSGKVAVEVTWSGSDQGAGLSLYELGQRRDSGAWGAAQPVPANEAGGEAAVTRSVAPQYGYTFRVRARDSAANQSGWALGRKVNIKRLQEASAQIKYQGRWTRPSTAAYWGGAAMRSTAAGANASLTFSGRSFAWVARTGPDRGKAAIYVNGVLVQTVDLYSPTVRSRRVVFAEHWETSGNRTVSIRVLGTAGRPTVELDALLTGD